MNKISQKMISCISNVLNQTTENVKFDDMTEDELLLLFQYAAAQGVLWFLKDYPILRELLVQTEYDKQMFIGIGQQKLQMIELQTVMDAFEENKIPCLLLKGVITQNFYPRPEYRTMGDVDLLYHPEQTKLVRQVLAQLGFATEGDMIKHDVYQKNMILIEMHKSLGFPNWKEQEYFSTIWERVCKKEGYQYLYEMTLEDHYLFTLTHLAEHFQTGGIGLRMVMDIYVLSQVETLNWEYVNQILKEIQYQEFHNNILALSMAWFSGENGKSGTPEELGELEDYILQGGGVFGGAQNDHINLQVKYDGNKKFLRQLIFPGYLTMQTVFPWLKSPLLLPIAWVIRGFQAMFRRRDNMMRHLKRGKTFKGNHQEIAERAMFFEKYGLKLNE